MGCWCFKCEFFLLILHTLCWCRQVQYLRLQYIVLQVHHFTSCFTSTLETQFDKFSCPFHGERFIHTILYMSLLEESAFQSVMLVIKKVMHRSIFVIKSINTLSWFKQNLMIENSSFGNGKANKRHSVFWKGYNIMSMKLWKLFVPLGLVTNTISIHCMLQ